MSRNLGRAHAWIVSDDTGMSSKYLWSCMMGVPVRIADYPHDPDDIGRCFRLLRSVPEWRARLGEVMGTRSAEWAALIARWDEIEQAFVGEVGGLDPDRGSRAPYTYQLMREILDGARKPVPATAAAE